MTDIPQVDNNSLISANVINTIDLTMIVTCFTIWRRLGSTEEVQTAASTGQAPRGNAADHEGFVLAG